MREFKLPDPGEGLLEAEIVSWKVKVGDQVRVNDILLEIETAKSLVELPSPFNGVVAEMLVAEGDTVEVGTPIIRIEDGASVAQAPTPAEPDGTVAEPDEAVAGLDEPVAELDEPVAGLDEPVAELDEAPALTGNVQDDLGEVPVSTSTSSVPQGADAESVSSGSLLVGYGAKAASITRRPRRSAGAVSVPGPETGQVHGSYDTAAPVSRHTDDVTPSAPVSASPSGERLPQPGRPVPEVERGRPPLAKPPVRRIARDLGIDLTHVPGTGPGGTITAEDVVTAAQGGRPSTGDRRVQLKGIRREMFRAMTASLKVPQATAFSEVDVTGTMELMEILRSRREFAGLRVSPLLVFAKAACLAIARNPEINSSFDESTEEMVLHGEVNLGIAAATPRGLVVPNIKRAGRMNLLELAQALNEMVAVAKQGRVQPGDLALGTFTITNVGVFGVDGGTPIMNPGEAAIMCLGTVRRKPWVMGTGEDEHIEIRSVCTVSLTFDHRLVDGEMGSRFLADVTTIMTDPGLSLLF